MSKTIGNVIGIEEMLEKFGVDGTRYLLMSAGTFGEDVDMTMERMIEKYNADLANGLGNLLSRVLKLAQISNIPASPAGGQYPISNKTPSSKSKINDFLAKLEISNALSFIWNIVRGDNKYIEDEKPWELVKSNQEKFEEVMGRLILDLYKVASAISPFMPNTSKKIESILSGGKAEILFKRLK